MATLQKSAPASHSIRALHRVSIGVRAPLIVFLSPSRYAFSTHFSLRLHNEISLHGMKRRSPVPASNTNPSDQSNDDAKNSDTAQGPPFLTILAGLLVFFTICWIIGSIVMWLVGLVLKMKRI